MSLAEFLLRLGIREFVAEGQWGHIPRYSRLRDIHELDDLVQMYATDPKGREGYKLKVVSKSKDIVWLFYAPDFDGGLVARRGREHGVILPPSCYYGGLDYVFWKAKYAEDQFWVAVTTEVHSEAAAHYRRVDRLKSVAFGELDKS
jgi:hypothetical protein